jgi:hypothetical protein
VSPRRATYTEHAPPADNTGRMASSLFIWGYQHATSLPRSRYAIHDSDWPAGNVRIVSYVQLLVLDRFGGGSPILGFLLHSRSWGLYC